MALILASGSPRRRELMALITPDYTVITSDVDEGKIAADTPAHLAQSLASAKARAVAKLHPADTVLGFDTVVDCGGEVFGKPQDEADALRMLRALSGRTHKVHTGVCICKGGRAAALADADAGVHLVGAAGECPQHAQGVGFILGFPEYLTAAVHHSIKAEDGIRRVQFGHSAGLGRSQALRQVSRGIGGDLTLVHIAGDDGIVRCDECHQFAAARAAGCQDQCHSRVSFRV